jgi:VanZ family protein
MTAEAAPATPYDPRHVEPENRVLGILGHWGVVVTWMLVISVLSGEPFSAENTNRYLDPVLRFFFTHLTPAQFTFAHTVIRKSAHFTEFFILGSLAFWASRRGRMPGWCRAWMLQAIGLAVVYSLVDEVHQAFVPNRTSSLTDSAVDSIGAVTSQALIYLRHLKLTRLGILR